MYKTSRAIQGNKRIYFHTFSVAEWTRFFQFLSSHALFLFPILYRPWESSKSNGTKRRIHTSQEKAHTQSNISPVAWKLSHDDVILLWTNTLNKEMEFRTNLKLPVNIDTQQCTHTPYKISKLRRGYLLWKKAFVHTHYSSLSSCPATVQ